jgi:LCP family protein required for cell wall assembly
MLRRTLITALSFTTLLGVLSGAVIAYAYAKYDGQIHRVDALQTKDRHIREAEKQAHAVNFLIIGSDSRQGANARYGHAPGQRSDTTIVVHLSADRHRATVVSIPRDAWVRIPPCTDRRGRQVGAHDDMFNSAFSVGGPRCTIATVQALTGIAITHYLQIDFMGFREVVDALGRVTVCSPEAVTDSGTHLRLKKGANELDGREALRYVRARESLGDGSDLGRIKRQQQFLGVVLRQAMSGSLLTSPGRLTHFLDALTHAVTVDRGTSFNDLRTLASSLHGLDPKRVTFYTAPIADPNYSPPGTSYTGKVKLDETKGRALYQSIIDDTPPAPSPHRPKPNQTAAQNTCKL